MDAYIYDAIRTPRGSIRKNGSLKHLEPVELFSLLAHSLNKRNPSFISSAEDVILGCVTQIKEQGANIAKTAVMYAGLPTEIPALTLTRLCTSSLDAIAIAASKVHSQNEDVILAGGLESVSKVPMFSDEGVWFTNTKVSELTKFIHMGLSADLIATVENLERAELDAYAVRSHERAAKANKERRFHRSLVPVELDNQHVLDADENVRADTSMEKLAVLEPCFEPFLTDSQRDHISRDFPELDSIRHTHHVGNSPSLADAAGLLVIGNAYAANKLKQKPLARIIGTASIAAHPMLLFGGQKAAEKLLTKLNLSLSEIDVIEFYEAYAATSVKAMKDWQVDEQKFNPNGGVIATGHALGATGAIMLCSLLDELQNRNGRYGLIAMSGGGGVGTAMVIERLVHENN